jgi:uncharacterized surface protein with fasciclin (FAS1) repeats
VPTETAWAIVQGDPNLDSFEQIVIVAGMQSTLESGSVTVLAPDNGAIGDITPIVGDPATAQSFVESHIISGSLDSAAIFATTSQTTLDGDTLTIDGVAQTITGPSLDPASMVSPDHAATNGFVHVISAVLDVPAPPAATTTEPPTTTADTTTTTVI